MPQIVQIQLLPEDLSKNTFIKKKISEKLSLKNQEFSFEWHKKSIDARNPIIKVNASFLVYLENENKIEKPIFWFEQNVTRAKEIFIIGAGPAGLFAGLRAIELGFKPIIFERGKDVRSRRRDLAILNKEGIVNTESNYCFGEGGAGTYSDGKLYTRSKKRGDVEKAMHLFVEFGANPEILIEAHPHIGTNKLPQIIVAMREKIIACGGEVHFNAKLTDVYLENQTISGIEINSSTKYTCKHLILATGHSARDIFYLLHQRGIEIKAKGFALGVRIEHQQALIDKMQYHGRVNDEFLPPAAYSLVTQVENKGVYSFCMCPGGIIAPCATDQEEVVTNGWSPSKRNNPYSNSGIVVSIDPSDFPDYENKPFVCLDFQKEVEKKCWEAAGKNAKNSQKVPVQCLQDFIDGKVSKEIPRSSYQPGFTSLDLNEILPKWISRRLKQAFLDFDKKMKGFVTNDAVLHAPESRTSSPIQIPRNPTTLQHVQIQGLYPCAEGAGYAGGIISAAIDGMNCVEAISETYKQDLTL
jgi:uncharacterized protein